MKSKCPVNDLLKFIKETKKNPNIKVPQELVNHAKTCDKCSEILGNPKLWDSFININEELKKTSNLKNLWIATPLFEARNDNIRKNNYHKLDTKKIKEGVVCRIKIENTSNSAFVLITDVSNLKKDGFIRISPIFISPHDDDIDEETDIIIPASKMPTRLPSLIEWWNDRPILANSINNVFGQIASDDLKIIKQKLINQPKITKSTKSILIFRELEKSKGNQMSASFFEMFVANEKIENNSLSISTQLSELDNNNSKNNVIPFNKTERKPFSICYNDLFLANEELKLAADSKDIYSALKEYLKNYYSNLFEVTKIDDGSNSLIIKNSL